MTTRVEHRFGALDALRGVAALAVLAYHFRWFFSPQYSFPGGYLAVDLFFLLSGFVIGHAYDDKIHDGMTTAAFIERRLIRFLPLLWIGIAFGTASLIYQLQHGSTEFTKRDIVLSTFHNALLIPSNFGKGNLLFPTDWPEWSLFFELFINCVYVAFYRYLSIRSLAVIVGVGLIAMVATALHVGSLDAGVFFGDLYAGFVRVTFSFFAGLLLYRTRSTWSSSLPRFSVWVIAFLLTLALLVPVGEGYRAFYDAGFAVILSPLIVMAGSVSPAVSGSARTLAVWLGVISYPIYTIHDPLHTWTDILNGGNPPLGSWWAILIVISIVAIAWPLERVYHRRMSEWLSRLAGTRSSAFASAGVTTR